MSVLYESFAEIDLDEPPQSHPEEGYFNDLVDHLNRTEAGLLQIDRSSERHLVAKSAADLDAATSSGRLSFVHCVEGGFHLGQTPESVAANVGVLPDWGVVVYVTLADLFYRGVATNAPALPMLSDRWYNRMSTASSSRPCPRSAAPRTCRGSCGASAVYYAPDVADAILYRARVVRQALTMRQA